MHFFKFSVLIDALSLPGWLLGALAFSPASPSRFSTSFPVQPPSTPRNVAAVFGTAYSSLSGLDSSLETEKVKLGNVAYLEHLFIPFFFVSVSVVALYRHLYIVYSVFSLLVTTYGLCRINLVFRDRERK